MLEFTTQAWVYLIISALATIIALGLSIYNQGFGLYIIAYVIYFFMLLLGAYNISCLTKGECETWSWFVTILSILPMILIISMSIYIAVVGKDIIDNSKNVK